MNKNKMATRVLTVMALCIGINYIGGTIALWLRLPIYLDSIGTIFAGALLGPVPGMLTGLSSGILSGVTTDIFSVLFANPNSHRLACWIDFAKISRQR